MPTNLKYWLGFNQISGIGASRLRGLLTYFHHDLAAAWYADAADLHKAGLGEKTTQHFLQQRRQLQLDGLVAAVEKLGAWISTWEDETYPAMLKMIEDAPPVLYIKGDLLPSDERAVAIVGTRKATLYGREAAKHFASALAKADITIVSGLALGIDSTAQQAAIDAGGRTIGVMASGIDKIYPAESKKLVDQLLASGQGAILTEYPPQTPPDSRHFPARNRLISGLSVGVLVVEAPKNSGALLTADFASEQGRDVFAIPGNINSPNSVGTNLLIQQGAKLVTVATDILEELQLDRRPKKYPQDQPATQSFTPTSRLEIQLLQTIAREALHVDEIAFQVGKTVHEVSAMMMLLELHGVVVQSGNMVYRLATHIDVEALLGDFED